jgi:hypothetical protein
LVDMSIPFTQEVDGAHQSLDRVQDLARHHVADARYR